MDWYVTEDGIPVFDACAARFECATRQVLEVGDHAVLIGEVRRLHAPTTTAAPWFSIMGPSCRTWGIPSYNAFYAVADRQDA
ncbi:flavin reductase family protein [Achromobacter insuavis]